MRRTIASIIAVGSIIGAGAIGGFVATSTNVGAATVSPSGLVILPPGRVLDTRGGSRLSPGQTVTVSTGIQGASAAAVNITLTETIGGGFVTAWAGGPRPNTSIINSYGPDQNVANFAIVPVNLDGTFQLFTSNTSQLVVDLMGYFPGSTPPAPSGITGQITGYGPSSSFTNVSGTVTNGGGAPVDVRADVRCVNGTVEIDYSFDLPAGQTRGFSVLCDGVFTSGASVIFVEV